MSEEPSEDGEGLEYSEDSKRYRVEFSRGDDQPSTAVVKAVAAISGKRQDDLDPLFYVVDPDALDTLFRPTVNGGHRGDVEISFSYHGYDVTVHSYGIIDIEAIEGESDRRDR